MSFLGFGRVKNLQEEILQLRLNSVKKVEKELSEFEFVITTYIGGKVEEFTVVGSLVYTASISVDKIVWAMVLDKNKNEVAVFTNVIRWERRKLIK